MNITNVIEAKNIVKKYKGFTLNVPEFHVPEDFYYTPVWDAETQLTDFEDSPLYQQIVQTEPGETEAQSRSDSDSDFNWDSNDSWDSGDTDWDSDW